MIKLSVKVDNKSVNEGKDLGRISIVANKTKGESEGDKERQKCVLR